jgi:ABC-type lipoprotein release transport system permease subunit
MTWIEKQRYFIDFAISSLMRRRQKNLALVAVYTLVVFILASIVFFTQAIKREARIILEGSPDIVVQRLMAGRHDLMPAHYVDTMRKITGTTDVRGRLWAYYFDPASRANYTIVVDEMAGRYAGGVVIGKGLSRVLGAGIGDQIILKGYDGSFRRLKVYYVFPSDSELVSSDLIRMSEKDFRALFNVPATLYTDAVISVRNPRETRVVSDKIQRMLPDTRPIIRSEILRTYDSVFDWRSGLLLVIFTGALLAFFIFAWDKATSLSMEEKKEIGILKAVGWETSEVLALKSWEGLIISLSSFMSGIILAYIHVFIASSTIFEPVLKGWAVIYPSFRLIPAIDFSQVAALLFLTVIPYTAATIIPSWFAATIDPDTVMRL